MIPEKYRLKNTIKYPTSIIIGGLNKLGLEIADSLIEQGGYVIIVDTYTPEADAKLSVFSNSALVSFLDYTAIPHIDEDIRRLDYIFYFQHQSEDLNKKISTSEFLNLSNYLDASLNLAKKFNAKFLLTTSIKAHQLILSRQDLNLEFGYGTSSSRHTIYTEMELQKYAESLAIEYFERDKLDTRIIRLGELIGDGIDFNDSTAFSEILLDAVTNNQIRLRKDGLDTEWYVNILDAAYGIIKAQFSRVTTGEIYSLTYETPFTNLSVAYKIQEYDSDVREIVFIDETDNLPALKLYKPAPNLSSIGWSPKVNFDKAVKQSLAAAKIFMLETRALPKGNSNLVDKIKGFLAIAETDVTMSPEAGAVSRLISERKRQEELKKQSINSAALATQKRRKPKRTFKEKLNDGVWEFFRGLGESFNIFKNKSPTQIVVMLSIILVLVIFYINYFSPIIALGRNMLILYPEIATIEENVNKGNFTDIKSNLDTVSFHFEDTRNIFAKFQGVASLLALDKQYNEVQKNLEAYSLFIDGAKNLSKGLEPFNSYLKSLQNNTLSRAATDSYISLSSSGLDYSEFFSKLNNSLPYVQDGVTKIQKSSGVIESLDYTIIPDFLAQNLSPLNKRIISIADVTEDMGTVKYLDSILGIDSPKTYLFLILDNTIPTPLGGYISAYAMITMNKGSIVEAVVQSTDDTNFKFGSLSDSDIQLINLRKFGIKTKANITINDLSSIKDIDDFNSIITKVFKDSFSRDLSGVVTINTDSLNSLVQFVSQNTSKTTEINSVTFGNDDLLKQVNLAQSDNGNLRSRNAVLAQLAGFVVNNAIDVFKSNSAGLVSTLTNSALNRDILISISDLDYQDYIVSKDFNQSAILNNSLPVDIAFSIYDPKYLGSDKIPSFTVAIESQINSDLSLDNRINFKFPQLASTSEVSLCLPASISDSLITVDNIPVERYIKTSYNEQKCTNIQIISESSVGLKWKTSTVGKLTSDSLREISYGILKIRGSSNTLDMKVTADALLKVEDFVPRVGQNGNSFAFTSQPKNDTYVKIVLKK